jgi:hypothetical protein
LVTANMWLRDTFYLASSRYRLSNSSMLASNEAKPLRRG